MQLAMLGTSCASVYEEPYSFSCIRFPRDASKTRSESQQRVSPNLKKSGFWKQGSTWTVVAQNEKLLTAGRRYCTSGALVAEQAWLLVHASSVQ